MPFNKRDRVMVEMPGVVNPRYREKVVYSFVGKTFYVISDMDNRVVGINLANATSVRPIKSPPRIVPAVGPGGDLPPGLSRQECEVEEDFLDAYVEADHLRMEAVAENMEVGMRAMYEIPEPPPRTEEGGWADDGRTLTLPQGWVVITSETVGESLAGTLITPTGNEVGRKLNGLRWLDDGRPQRVEVLKDTALAVRQEEFRGIGLADPRILDLRTLPGSGERGRTWRDCVESSRQEPLTEDQGAPPVDGPLIAMKCLQFLYKINKDPVEWSNHWRVTVVQLDSEHPDAERHLSGAEMALVGGTWDQYDLSNGMMAEKAFRNMCLAEYEQNKKLDAKELEKATSSVGNTTNFERSIVLGNRSTRGKTMIPPEFTTYLSSKLKEKGEEQKTGRKLREELEALKKKK